jgi:hypothetical protein
MNFRELIKINPVRFCLFVIITVLTPITLIGNTALVQLETTILLSRNLQNFLIISASKLNSFWFKLCIYKYQPIFDYLSSTRLK